MSGVAKSIGKVFKSVTDTVKKVAPFVLAAGAVLFTAGAALGLGPLAAAGGWGGAVSSLTSAVGLGNSTLGGVLTGAITQAGYGAALGGAISAATGGSFANGAATGALAGAATGGIMGGLGMGTDPFGAKGGAASSGPASSGAIAAQPTGVVDAGAANVGPASGAATSAQTGGLLTPVGGVGDFLSKNQTLVGTALSGVGNGLMQGMAANEVAKRQEQQRQAIAQSYDVPSSVLTQPVSPDVTQRPTPAQAFAVQRADPAKGRYVYNRSTGTIDWMPTQTQTA